jgi:hypothetical protein
MPTVSEDPTAGPALRVVKGDPRAVELAALVAVLAATTAASMKAPTSAPSMWGHPSAAMRRSLPVGPDGWRASSRPAWLPR